jgi:predicted ATPase
MFELGARPHPPRDLYRSYLQRSEIFLGIYWRRYGWVAPDETVSGLEDEYNLAPATMPRLIYIKSTDDVLEPRLIELLQRIKNDDRASYKSFDTVEELRELVEADLATLLADRFDASQNASVDSVEAVIAPPQQYLPSDTGAGAIPAPLTSLLGRDREFDRARSLLLQDGVRLVTLTGPGGVGKSRLAIELGRSVREEFPDGVVFVSLAAAHDADQVPAAIADALGVRDTGAEPLVDTLTTALRGRRVLLIADNFEQVMGATPALIALLAALPGLSFLVTSRTVLRVLGEYRVDLGPLALPAAGATDVEAVLESAAVQLFVQRARSVAPEFVITADNVAAVVGICRKLDGVPLALELAAASIRLLPPSVILTRLEQHRGLASGTPHLPARQRSLDDTIEWSVQLLPPREKTLLQRLGVFSGGFSLTAAEVVAGEGAAGEGAAGEGADVDVLDSLGALADSSLIRQQDHGEDARFTLFGSVRDYARRGLEASDAGAATHRAHARYFADLGYASVPLLRGRTQSATMRQLADDRDNLRAAVHYLIEHREWDRLARLAWDLYVYWWMGGLLNEVRGWMDELLASGDAVDDSSRAIALYYSRAITFWQQPAEVIPGLTESSTLFHAADDRSGEALARTSLALALLTTTPPEPVEAEDELERSLTLTRSAGDTWGEALVLVTLGRVAIFDQKLRRALNRFEESLEVARRQGDDLSAAIAENHLGWAHLMLGDVDTARVQFRDSLAASALVGHTEGMAYGLEGAVAVAAADGDIERTGLLLGASEALRERSGLYNVPTFSFHQQAIAPILAGDAAAQLRAAQERGRLLLPAAAVALAVSPPSPPHVPDEAEFDAAPRAEAETAPDLEQAARS